MHDFFVEMLRVSALRTAFLKGQAFAFLQCGMSRKLSVFWQRRGNDVTRKLSVPRQTIRSWQVNNFRIERRPVLGRPRTCSRRRDRRIVSLSRSDSRLSVREIAAVTGCLFGTVLRSLKEAGLVSRRRTLLSDISACACSGQCVTVIGEQLNGDA